MYKNDLQQERPPLVMEESKISTSQSQEHKVNAQFALSMIIPTRNEAGNIKPLLDRIGQATRGISTEVVFVDDSTDNTAEIIRSLQEHLSLHISLIIRPPERRKSGLGGAVVEGFKVAQAPWVCVMDADLQHPPEFIPMILNHAQKTGSDVVVGSRLAPGGDASSLGLKRTIISQVFAMTTRVTFPQRLRAITDPLTGFFILRRDAVNPDDLHPDGFKILLEILVSHPSLIVSEIPIRFGYRNAGESKASVQETIRFARGLFRLRLAGNENFIRFLIVGVSGLLVNSLVLAAFTELGAFNLLLSAVLATQASTLWNFGLTEGWVFRKRTVEQPLVYRLVGFLLINNLLLLVRGPMLSLMVTQLGIHYLISNLLSIFALTLIRYAVADRWIWGKALTTSLLPNDPTLNNRRNKMTKSQPDTALQFKPDTKITEYQQPNPFIYSYNIHNILRVASMFRLPELEYFRVPALLAESDIRLRLERRRKDRRRNNRVQSTVGHRQRAATPRRSDAGIHYDETFGRFGFEVSITHKEGVEVAVSSILQHSLHVLYTNVIEPILRWAMVRKGYALVHAACIAADGKAVLITARTDTGKTSTILRAVDNYSCSFLSDDMTIVSRDGLVMSYPKPLTISNHTLSAVNANSSLSIVERMALQIQSRLHSKSGRHVGLELSKTNLPAATMNTIVQMLIPPPKYMVHRLIPKVSYTNSAKLSHAVIIERGPEHEEFLPHDQAVKEFVRNAEDAYGFPPYPVLVNFISKWEEKDLHPIEQAIVAEALTAIPTIRIRDPKFNWWQRLPVVADNMIAAPMQLAGIDAKSV
jgi:glycosyltransferase involved in cell wall biosynthesis